MWAGLYFLHVSNGKFYTMLTIGKWTLTVQGVQFMMALCSEYPTCQPQGKLGDW